MPTDADVAPPLRATPEQTRATLGAMRAVAETGGPASGDDRTAVLACARFMFGATEAWDGLAPTPPAALAAALGADPLAEDALKLLAVMALVDGRLDPAKVAAVAAYAAALGRDPRFLDELVAAAQGRLAEALADMTRANMESVTGKPWPGGDATPWLMPYHGSALDPALAARFEALGALPERTFGHAFWAHFHANGYAFPGAAGALNAAFSAPHDSAHVIAGFDTTPRGELLVSTFTAAMHRVWPMAGHVLPVLFTWHLKTSLNAVTGAVEGALDPSVFWRAWAGGAAARLDTFAPGWDFWAATRVPLAELRRDFGLPAEGLDLPHGQTATAGA